MSNDILDKLDGFYDLPRVTRFEVIDETGRVYVRYGIEAELSIQDNGRTLKVFVDKRVKDE